MIFSETTEMLARLANRERPAENGGSACAKTAASDPRRKSVEY
jgi:hypothetical protein